MTATTAVGYSEEPTVVTLQKSNVTNLHIHFVVGNRYKLAANVLSFCANNDLACNCFSQPMIIVKSKSYSPDLEKEVSKWLTKNNVRIQPPNCNDGDVWGLTA
jgi:hypothetical protein